MPEKKSQKIKRQVSASRSISMPVDLWAQVESIGSETYTDRSFVIQQFVRHCLKNHVSVAGVQS